MSVVRVSICRSQSKGTLGLGWVVISILFGTGCIGICSGLGGRMPDNVFFIFAPVVFGLHMRTCDEQFDQVHIMAIPRDGLGDQLVFESIRSGHIFAFAWSCIFCRI